MPKWFKKAVSILSIFLYSGDVGSDFWVAIDLIKRCHYKFGAAALSWLVIPGFIQGWVEFFYDHNGECSLKNVLKALFYPFFFIPYTLWKLIQAAIAVFKDHDDDDDYDMEDKMWEAKL